MIDLFIQVRIFDIIDIFLVALLFYWFYRILKGTTAISIFLGIVAIFLSWQIVKALQMELLSSILGAFVSVGFIALIIIFQPELRRLLENLGRNKLINNFSGIDLEEAEQITKEIKKALLRMSRTRTGALIVIERETTLTDIIETGTVIDASISSEMIGNIFYEGAPLHDGALIIRGDKLKAAGCVLPLTEDKKLSKELGTRHRAGIGITENSDALVFIVSEESGIISKAEDGRLERRLNGKRIEEILSNLYIVEDKDSLIERVSRIVKGGRNNAEK